MQHSRLDVPHDHCPDNFQATKKSESSDGVLMIFFVKILPELAGVSGIQLT